MTLRTTSRQKVHVKRFKSKEVGIKKLQEALLFLAQANPQDKKLARNVKPYAGAERVPCTLGEARGDLLARRRRSWRMCGIWFIVTMSSPENNCVYRKSHRSQFLVRHIDVVRQQKTIWTIWKRAVSTTDGTLTDEELSQKVGPDPCDSAHFNKTSTPRCDSWVDGRETKTQVISRPKT